MQHKEPQSSSQVRLAYLQASETNRHLADLLNRYKENLQPLRENGQTCKSERCVRRMGSFRDHTGATHTRLLLRAARDLELFLGRPQSRVQGGFHATFLEAQFRDLHILSVSGGEQVQQHTRSHSLSPANSVRRLTAHLWIRLL